MQFRQLRDPDARRFQAALRGEETGEVPYFETEMAPQIVSIVLEREMQVPSLQLPAADYVEFLQRTNQDAAYIHLAWPLGREVFFDDQGYKHLSHWGIIKNDNDLSEQFWPPDLGEHRRRLDSFFAQAEGTGLGCIVSLPAAPFVVQAAIGMDDYFYLLYDQPDFIHRFTEQCAVSTTAITKLALEYPLTAVMVPCFLNGNSGPLISMEMHNSFFRPALTEQLRLIHGRKLPLLTHLDGHIAPCLPTLLALGYQGVHPIEPAVNDIYAIKQDYGSRLCLMGNIDLAGVLSQGTPADVEADVREHLHRLAPGGRYILTSSHHISEDIPPENLHRMMLTTIQYHQKTSSSQEAN